MKTKVLFVNLPYHGHMIPTIGLVQEVALFGTHAKCALNVAVRRLRLP